VEKNRVSVLQSILSQTSTVLDEALSSFELQFQFEEVGRVASVEQGIARIEGLANARSEELLYFEGGFTGMAFNLDPDEVGAILLSESRGLRAGGLVYRTGQVLNVPVGDVLLGRVVDALGRPLDNLGPLRTYDRLPVERSAPSIVDRAPVDQPLQTGIKVVDALFPIGRGQRELILGDRQTGKTAIALDTILNQRGQNVICVYCAIGQRDSVVARLIADLEQRNALPYTIVMTASDAAPTGLQYIAPYAATSMAEYFMQNGRDVLIVYDDLIHHAYAYRELSLLLRRPPGREAFPGDIFYIHSRLLERATHLNDELGGGSLTALPIAQTHAQNISAYIPTNLISITDGQIYLSPGLHQKGVLPAVDVGRSVSRVGGKAQLPAYRAVTRDLRLAYSQFEELEIFSRFGSQLEAQTQKQLERGRRVREVLKQPEYEQIPVAEQIIVLLAVTEGHLDQTPVERIGAVSDLLRQASQTTLADLKQQIDGGQELGEEDMQRIRETIQSTIERTLAHN